MATTQRRNPKSRSPGEVWAPDFQVAKRYGVSVPTVWRWARLGVLPKPTKIGPNTRRWHIPTLDDHDSQRRKSAV